MSIIVSILTAPMNLLVDFIFENILSAPTSDVVFEERVKVHSASRISLSESRSRRALTKLSSLSSDLVNHAVQVASQRRTLVVATRLIPSTFLDAHLNAKSIAEEIVFSEEKKQLGEANDNTLMSSTSDELYREFLDKLRKQRLDLSPKSRSKFDNCWE